MMFKKIMTSIYLVLVVAIVANAQALKPSLWEHPDPEISVSAPIFTPGTSPLTYGPSSYDRERELYSYKPRFKPNTVTFDYNNRPFIMVAKLANEVPADNTYTYFSREWYDGYYVQTLDQNNQWVMVDVDELYKQIPAYSGYTNFEYRTGLSVGDDKVAFDSNGGIYFYTTEPGGVYLGSRTAIPNRLFYCPGGDISQWQSYQIPGNSYIFETGDTFISDSTTPTVIGVGGTLYGAAFKNYNIVCNSDDTITVEPGVDMHDPNAVSPLTAPIHSGMVKTSITIGDTVHFVYLNYDTIYNEDETGQYYGYYNKATGEFSEPVFLGSTSGLINGDKPDTHNGPLITADSDKTLHVVLGAHGSMMKYTYSTDLGKTWEPAVDLYDDATYPSLVSTPDGTIHLVYRKSSTISSQFKYRLWYARKPMGGAWQDMGQIIEPAKTGYSIYYHKLTVDRIGRLFLAYYYLTAHHTQQELDDMAAKWPNDPPFNPAHIGYAHDAAILMSGDNGDSWKIATTDDFVAGITETVVYYNFNGDDKKEDLSGNARHLTGNSPFVVSKDGWGAYFDSTTSNLTSTFNQSEVFSKGSFSVSCNFKAFENPSGTGTEQHILGYRGGGPTGFYISVMNGYYRVFIYAAGLYQGSFSNATLVQVNQWKNITFTYQADGEADGNGEYNGTLKVYVDGELADETTFKFKPATAGIVIGSGSNGLNKFVGIVDDVAIYNFVLSEQQVAKLNKPSANPLAIHSEWLAATDFNRDGFVNTEDLVIFAEQFLID